MNDSHKYERHKKLAIINICSEFEQCEKYLINRIKINEREPYFHINVS